MTGTVTTRTLPRQLQRLIDARLDTIDRMLLGRLPREDRLAVVREVEGQVHELLGEQPGHELDREHVLTVLAKLDPPEAYLPEEGGYEETAVPLRERVVGAHRGTAERKPGQVVGILGLLLLGVILLWPITLMGGIQTKTGGLWLALLLGESAIMVLGGVPLFVMSIVYRRGGGWALVGMVAGIVGVLAGFSTASIWLVLSF